MKPFALVALVAFVAAGCGGASKTSSGLYTLAATKHCLRTSGAVHSFPPVGSDFVASTASNGALRARMPDSNAVTVLFGQSVDEAKNLADAYRRFHAKNVGIEDILRTQNNAVLLWQVHPSSRNETTLHDCLR